MVGWLVDWCGGVVVARAVGMVVWLAGWWLGCKLAADWWVGWLAVARAADMHHGGLANG